LEFLLKVDVTVDDLEALGLVSLQGVSLVAPGV